MPNIEPFEKYSKEYDEWFEKNRDIYRAELEAIRNMVPEDRRGIEIGVGTGKFALPLGIGIGVEPSIKMAQISKANGIDVCKAAAENLPFNDKTFDFVLMVTTICFVDDLLRSFDECFRVLKNDGSIIIGFIDKESELGKKYQMRKTGSKFYDSATFYSVDEVMTILKETGFKDPAIKQTIFNGQTDKMDTVRNGYSQGSFVIIKAKRT